MFKHSLKRLKSAVDRDSFHDPYLGLRIARIDYKKPYMLCSQYELIVLAIMQLLIKYAYSQEFKYAKFTIGYIMKVPSGDVPYIIGFAIRLNDNSIGNAHPNMTIYEQILNFLKVKEENYDGLFLSAVFIRMYSIDMVVRELALSLDEIDSQIWDLLSSGLSGGIHQEFLTIARGRKRSYKTYITATKSSIKDKKSFIVANLETILVNYIHKPYAAGYLVEQQGITIGALQDSKFITIFSENYNPDFSYFQDRSNRTIFGFLESLEKVANFTGIRIVYFLNFSHFDGIMNLKYYTTYGGTYTIKPLMRNMRIYTLEVYKGKKDFDLSGFSYPSPRKSS
ncbi:hypothetical protein GIB67_035635 [Kingdonia uniflora]|uniref:Uncharacterized protein n=1 Tax=Kingdonia uniflora TaxID=39325 RepID=A0A7J7MGQ2_9MAGN|nr:hypothetical protein GIB67_035635 [Kingdonia uniflora]